jgi:drug/metabolite transporter (DMT)-like permease|tara:strand:+ start:6771 stop:7634 length:864 start_codon:yes stop_codon:yes gene_type:complete
MKPHNQLLGILLMVLAVFLFPMKDAFAKMTDGYYSAIVIMWTQMVFTSLFYVPVITVKYGPGILLPPKLFLQVLRAISVITGIGMFYWAILLVPLAEATAISFVAPLVTTAVSPFMLGEKVGIRRWLAVLVGFIGVLIVLRPEFSGDRLGYMIAFGAGLAIGFFYAFNRLLAHEAPPIANLTYSAVIGAILLTPLIFSVWVPPRPEDTLLIIGFVAFAAMGQTCLFSAFIYGEASIIAPIGFTQIIGATLFGYMFFNDFPDAVTIIGILIVIASGVYIAIRETRPRE